MQFLKQDNVYKVIKVTGPEHNLLGLEFGESNKKEDVKIVELPISDGVEKVVDPVKVKEQVLAGVEETNAKLNTSHQVKAVYFVPSDSPNSEVYKELAEAIIIRLNSGEVFNS